MEWEFIGTSIGDKFIIDGVDIFKEKWENTGEIVQVRDPIYNQVFKFNVWKVNHNNKSIIFVAGEFSNCVFGIYTKR
jgi:hypothetical protein